MKIVLAGGSGQVGRMLARAFHARGDAVTVFSRSVNCRYGAINRRAILESRVQSTRVLNETIASLHQAPRLWINASTATIYRHSPDREMDEAAGELGGSESGFPDSWNFSINVAKAWEEAFWSTSTPRTRKVAIRSAMTFSPDRGGVFNVFSNLVRSGLGGRQGSGAQYVSWNTKRISFGQWIW